MKEPALLSSLGRITWKIKWKLHKSTFLTINKTGINIEANTRVRTLSNNAISMAAHLVKHSLPIETENVETIENEVLIITFWQSGFLQTGNTRMRDSVNWVFYCALNHIVQRIHVRTTQWHKVDRQKSVIAEYLDFSCNNDWSFVLVGCGLKSWLISMEKLILQSRAMNISVYIFFPKFEKLKGILFSLKAIDGLCWMLGSEEEF